MLFPGITGCWYYATEGRSYALVLAFTGTAALSWQSVSTGRGRTLGLLGLAASLMLALNVHYYSLLLFVPFGLAECVRTYQARRIDWALWGSLLLPLTALTPYLRLMQATRAGMGVYHHFVRPSWIRSTIAFSDPFLSPTLPVLVVIGCTYLVFASTRVTAQREQAPASIRVGSQFVPEIVLILAFACFPVFGIAFAKIATDVLFPRYLMPALFGISALLSLGLWFAASGRREPALIAAIVIGSWFLQVSWKDVDRIRGSMRVPASVAVESILPARARENRTLPIVAAQAGSFMALSYYGDPDLKRRMFYLADKDLSLQLQGFNFLDRILSASAPYFHTNVVSYRSFIRANPNFYVLGGLGGQEWILAKLINDNAEIDLVQGGPSDALGKQAEPCFLVQIRNSSNR
jgi:hypothetical protein